MDILKKYNMSEEEFVKRIKDLSDSPDNPFQNAEKTDYGFVKEMLKKSKEASILDEHNSKMSEEFSMGFVKAFVGEDEDILREFNKMKEQYTTDEIIEMAQEHEEKGVECNPTAILDKMFDAAVEQNDGQLNHQGAKVDVAMMRRFYKEAHKTYKKTQSDDDVNDY